jgi:hypothetical protein
MSNKYIPAIVLAAIISLFFTSGGRTSAAGVTIAPSLKDIRLEDEALVDVPIKLTNTTTAALKFAIEVRNFGALDDSGGVSFDTAENNGKYGLKDYVSLSKEHLTIKPDSRGEVVATISNANSLSPGGHYGAVVFTLVNANGQSPIPVKQEVAALLFVEKSGGDGPMLSTIKLNFQSTLFSAPHKADIVIANNGNVHAAPKGMLLMKDPRGRTLSSAPINSANGKVLPETVRKFVLGVETSKRLLIPGKYSLQVVSDSGTLSRSFILLPPFGLVILAIAALSTAAAGYLFRAKIARLRLKIIAIPQKLRNYRSKT